MSETAAAPVPNTAEGMQPLIEKLKPRIGQKTEAIIFEVEKNHMIRYARFTGETNPLYLDEAYAKTTKFGGLIASPTFMSWFQTGIVPDKVLDFDLGLPTVLHTDDIVETGAHIRPGDVITAVGELNDVFIRPKRDGVMLCQQADITLTNQKGEYVGKIRTISVLF